MVRSRAIALLLLLVVVSAAGCGESDEEKAQNQVCDARDDIQTQIDDLSNLKLSTATVDAVKEDLNAIRADLMEIANAQGDLNEERKQQVQSANKQFTSQLDSIASGLTSDLSLSGAKQKLQDATQQLATSYRETLGTFDCG
jgi:ribosomal protein L16 Arg81 hydroxylase